MSYAANFATEGSSHAYMLPAAVPCWKHGLRSSLTGFVRPLVVASRWALLLLGLSWLRVPLPGGPVVKVYPTIWLVPVPVLLLLGQLDSHVCVRAGTLMMTGILVCMMQLAIVVHELGHCYASRFFGLREGRIVLGGFFGAWIPDDDRGFEMLAPVPRLLLYAAGPMANIIVAAALLAATHLAGTKSEWQAVSYARMLAYANLYLGFLNLVPVPPLDGACIARSVLDMFGFSPWFIRKVVSLAGLVVAAGLACWTLEAGHWPVTTDMAFLCALALVGLWI